MKECLNKGFLIVQGLAKIRKGSENSQWQRKYAVAVAETAGDSVETEWGSEFDTNGSESAAQLRIFAAPRCPALPFAPLPILSKTSGAWVAKHSGAPAFFPPSYSDQTK